MAARDRERRDKAHRRAEARAQRRSKRHIRGRIKRYIVGGIIGLGGAAVVLSLVLPSSGGQNTGALGGSGAASSAEQGVQVEVQESEMVDEGQIHAAYNTNPPTSGWLYDIPLEDISWGPSSEPVAEEAQVSYLERGGVVVQYSCSEGCEDLVKNLESVVNRYPEGVILAPFVDMENTIALTSWGWIDSFDDFNDARVDDFIQTHIGQGPKAFR